MVCFLQYLMGRHWILENSGASRIFRDSPLKCLDELDPSDSTLDQCMYGAEQDGTPIRKSSRFRSDMQLKGMDTRCDRSHEHIQLKGHGPGTGSRTAAAARYPNDLCDTILDNASSSTRPTPQDGGRNVPSPHVFVDPPGFEKWSWQDQVAHRVRELRAVAVRLGHEELFKSLVEPWLDRAGPTGVPSNFCGRFGQPSDSRANHDADMEHMLDPDELKELEGQRAAGNEECRERSGATKASEASCDEGSRPVDTVATAMTNAANKMSDTLVEIGALCRRAGHPSDSRAAPAITSPLVRQFRSQSLHSRRHLQSSRICSKVNYRRSRGRIAGMIRTIGSGKQRL